MRMAAVVLALVLVGCGAGSADGGGGSSSDACRIFRQAAQDVTDGVLTDGEFRDRLQTVRAEARTSRPELREAATDLLAVVTDGDFGPRFDAAVTEMGDQCREDGN